MVVDFGTGDGGYVQRLAAARPDCLIIGVDANADNLREASRRAAAKPARGGRPNARFGRLALAEAPGELAGLADELTVLLPWGDLLRAVALAERAALGNLRGIARTGATVDIVFGFGAADRAATAALALPEAGALGLGELVARYREAGFAVAARVASAAEVAELPTTWARKLAFSDKARRFWRLRGRAI